MVTTVDDKQAEVNNNLLSRLADEDRVAWYRKPNLRYLYFMLFPTCMGIELTSGFDSQMINALQIVPSWVAFFGNPQGSLKGIIAAAYSLGAIISLPLVPVVNERFGRRWAIFFGSVVMIIGAIVQATSQNVAQYIIARIILGFGIPTCIVAGSSLIGELGYPKERPVLTSLFNVSYFIGQILAAGICLRTNEIKTDWAWRLPSILQAAPSLMQIAFVFFLPESPRFLISKGRVEEANEILRKYHGEGNADSEFVRAELVQIQTTLELEREASKRSWMDLVRGAGNRHRLIVTCFLGLFTQWSGNTLISYYLGDILKMIGQTNTLFQQRLNVGLAAWGGVVAFIAAMLVTRFKRRTMYMACTISLLLCYISWTISSERSVTAKNAGHPNKSANIAVIFFIFMYQPCYNIGYNALTYTYMVEIWPYLERSRGIAIFQLFGRLSGFFTTFVNPIGMQSISWKYLITYCCWLAFEIVFVYFLFPETAGRTLEELTFLFDKERSAKVAAATDKAIHGADPSSPSEKEKDGEIVMTERTQPV